MGGCDDDDNGDGVLHQQTAQTRMYRFSRWILPSRNRSLLLC